MSQFPPPPGGVEVVPGDVVSTPPKNPFASSAVWALGMAYLNHRIAKAVANGTLPDFLAPLMANAVFEVGMYVVSAVLLLWGRWGKIARPLGFGGSSVMALVKCLPLLLVLGCMSRAEHQATLATLEGPADRVADLEDQWASGFAGDSDGDGRVTDADDQAAAERKLPRLRDSPPSSRDAWLKAMRRRTDELRGALRDARTPTTQGS